MNQFLGTIALIPIENIINGLSRHDPHIAKQFRKFDGKVLEIISQSPALSISLRFEDDSLRISAIDSDTLGLEVDASISGKAIDLVQLLGQSANSKAMANSAININGDASLVQDIYKTIGELDIDWDDYLAPFLGDVISNELHTFSDTSRKWSDRTGQNIRRSVDEFLTEEARIIPAKEELRNFDNRLHQLKLNIDRTNAKAEQLRRRLNELEATQ